MQDSVIGKHTGFSVWMRTGRWPEPHAGLSIERKFNPWHDPDDGRFTFAGSGRRYGSAGPGQSAKPAPRPLTVEEPSSSLRKPGNFTGGGRGYGGAGAVGSWPPPTPKKPPRARQLAHPATKPSARPTGIPATTVKRRLPRPILKIFRRNGYRFDVSNLDRTIHVMGSIAENASQTRSRRLQAQAGGADRKLTDEGGHFIARQFNGPPEFFNHFAQDRTFNRGKYRRLERQWLREIRKGNAMPLRIDAYYHGTSRRPYELDIQFFIDGKKQSVKLPNGEQGEKNAKR